MERKIERAMVHGAAVKKTQPLTTREREDERVNNNDDGSKYKIKLMLLITIINIIL